MHDVRSFFHTYYVPCNAILSLSGNISTDEARRLAEKWFGPLPAGRKPQNTYPAEPVQRERRALDAEADVPADRLYKAWHCDGRTGPAFYATDLLSDILAKGHASRLYHALVRERRLFTEIQAYHSGDLDPALFVVEGRLAPGVPLAGAEEAVGAELQKMADGPATERELTKVKQMNEAAMVCSEIKIGHRALNLAFFEMLGDAGLVNRMTELYNAVSAEQIRAAAAGIFREENASVLYYRARKPETAGKQPAAVSAD
jgi:predicted Zn-dependent peptidase